MSITARKRPWHPPCRSGFRRRLPVAQMSRTQLRQSWCSWGRGQPRRSASPSSRRMATLVVGSRPWAASVFITARSPGPTSSLASTWKPRCS